MGKSPGDEKWQSTAEGSSFLLSHFSPGDKIENCADDLVDAGVRIIFNYSEALLDVPQDVAVHTSNPAVELLYALYFYLT
jgi:NADH/NAD ratio-sensing transcriptional regulator Rex